MPALTCSNLNNPNHEYTLTSNLSSAGTCFSITASNVTLDCNGYSITGGNSSGTYGVYSNQNSTTVKDCIISSFAAQVYYDSASSGGHVDNVTAISSFDAGSAIRLHGSGTRITGSNATALQGINNVALYLVGASNNVVSNTAVNGLGEAYAVFVRDSSANNTFAGITAASSESQPPIYIAYAASGNTVRDSKAATTFINGAITFDSGAANNLVYNTTLVSLSNQTLLWLGSTSGNNTFYWNNFTNTGGYYVKDFNNSSFYNSSIGGVAAGNIWNNVINGSVSITGNATSPFTGLYYGSGGSGYPYGDATAQGKLLGNVADYGPLTPFLPSPPALQCGNLSSSNAVYTMSANASANGSSCFIINATNVTLNCNGYTITGNNSTGSYGIHSNSPFTSIRNCRLQNFSVGVSFNSANSSSIANTSVSVSTVGYRILNSRLVSANNISTLKGSIGLSINGSTLGSYQRLNFSSTSAYGIQFSGTNPQGNSFSGISISASGTASGILMDTGSDNSTVDCLNGILAGTNASASSSGAGSVANGIIAVNVKNSSFRNCRLQDFGEGFEFWYQGVTAANVLVINNSVTSTGTGGVWGVDLVRGANFRFVSNNISTYVEAFRLRNIGAAANVTLANNTLHSTGSSAILMQASGNATFSQNNITAKANGVYEGSTGSNVIVFSGNRITALTGNAISASSYHNMTAANNVLNATGTSAALKVSSSSGAAVYNNLIIANGSTGTQLLSSRGAAVYNNTLLSVSQGLLSMDASSGNNTLYWNNFTNTSGYYVSDANGTNSYNSVEGNVWFNVMNGSLNIVGTANSTGYPGFYVGTQGLDYPYNSSTSMGKVVGNVVDLRPITSISGAGSICKTLTTPNSVETLVSDVVGSGGHCFTINATNVTLDGAGYTLTNGDVHVLGDEARVLNLGIDFSRGIILNQSSYGNYENLTMANAADFGVWMLQPSYYNNFTNASVKGAGTAFRIDGQSANPVQVNYCRVG